MFTQLPHSSSPIKNNNYSCLLSADSFLNCKQITYVSKTGLLGGSIRVVSQDEYEANTGLPPYVSCVTFTGEALEVEVLVLHSQHLALTWLPTLVALDQGLLGRVVVCVLRMSHCKR